MRRNLLRQFDVHTLLRLPTGIFYAQGVKANVLFFDARPAQEAAWTKRLWVYDLRTNMHFTLKTNPLKRADLDEFVKCYKPANRHRRKATWSEESPKKAAGRWRAFDYDEIVRRDKANLDILSPKDLAEGREPPFGPSTQGRGRRRRRPAGPGDPGRRDHRRPANRPGPIPGRRRRPDTDGVIAAA